MIWTQAGVFTEVHLTHAALTERFKDLVMTEGLADHRRLSYRGIAASAYARGVGAINGEAVIRFFP